MPGFGICQAQKKAPPKRGQFAHREVDSGLSMLANNCSRQAFSNMFVCARKRKKTNMPRPRGRGFWAHYSPIVPIPGFVGVIRERDQVVWLLLGGDIDHTALGFFHDFAQFCEDLVFGHGFDVFVCDV